MPVTIVSNIDKATALDQFLCQEVASDVVCVRTLFSGTYSMFDGTKFNKFIQSLNMRSV